jgi:D-serine deaminase-like pyridoxal phosphate-dependent protein
MIETSTLTASDDFMFDDRIRDVPPGTAAFPASAGASRNWRPIDGVMALPALALHETVFTSNRDLVLRNIRARGAEIAPHAKTPMSLDLARSLIDAGAWGATVADVSSARQAFRPASRVWAEILSRPEPICSMDVRDVSFDQSLPVVLGGHPNSDTVARKPRARVVKLNDQRAFVTREPDADFRSGDAVEFGVSHPCTFFDRYRVIFSLDESGRVRRAYPTTSDKSTIV